MYKVCKRKLDVGMTIDVSRLLVKAPWADTLKGTKQRTLFIQRLERKYGTNTRGQQVLQHTICTAPDGAYVVYYHHFEEKVRLIR